MEFASLKLNHSELLLAVVKFNQLINSLEQFKTDLNYFKMQNHRHKLSDACLTR